MPESEAEGRALGLEVPGTRIGPYRLLQQIGEGGFGAVFLAEQIEPMVRRVALKVIKLGMDTRQVIARFESERQALAMMEHPNIARVLDAGATEAGRPYFVMELVRGEPITTFCDKNKLSTTERLDLFQQVCHAVQHAHQKGIIHRDIKPSNVLVTLHDEVPVPKIIDFGIAKATIARLTEKTLFTQHRALIGTPEYMSPEQAGSSGVDIDTRSDIYSLGVLLYELLTGTTPFSAHELREGAFDEIQRIIREVDPLKPSTRLSTMTSTIASVAAHRQTEPARLAKLVRGDLDCIVMKCIEKDRTRRYETANGLALDVMRHLHGEPVLAAPPSPAYRARKFIRRHRTGVAAGVAIASLLVLGMAGTTSGLAWAVREQGRAEQSARAESEQRRLAEASARVATKTAREAKQSAEQARSVTDFLTGILGLANADISQNPGLTVREILDRAAERVGEVFPGQPEAEATVRTVIGQAYDTIGEPTQAVIHLGRALELRDGAAGGTPAQFYEILYTYMYAVRDATRGAGHVPRGGDYRVAIACQRTIAVMHPGLSETWAPALRALQKQPMDERSIATLIAEALRRSHAELSADDPDWVHVADHCFGIANAMAQQNADLAIQPIQEALAMYRRALPETHTRIVRLMDALVGHLETVGRHTEAEDVARRTLDLASRRLAETHWYVAWCRGKVGSSLLRQGRLEEAEPLLLSAFRVLDASNHRPWRTVQTLVALVELYERAGRQEEAEHHRVLLVERVVSGLEPDSEVTADMLLGPERSALAAAVRTLDADLREARTDIGPRHEAFVALRRQFFVDSDPRAACLVGLLLGPAQRYANSGVHREAALGVFEDFVEVGRACGAMPAGRRVHGLWWCSRLCEQLGRFAEGEASAREGLREVEAPLGTDHWMVANLRGNLGMNLIGLGREAEGERMLVAGYDGLMSTVGPANGNTWLCFQSLIGFYAARGRTHDASRIAVGHLGRLLASDTDPSRLNDPAWCVVAVPGMEPEAYAAALDASTRVIAAQTYANIHLNTLGVAQYRLRLYEVALETLLRSAELSEREPAGTQVADYAFIAMTHARLGHPVEAAEALARARGILKVPAQASDPENQGFLREAEEIVEGN